MYLHTYLLLYIIKNCSTYLPALPTIQPTFLKLNRVEFVLLVSGSLKLLLLNQFYTLNLK